jgi:trans-aconitate methyltransferase
MLKPQVGNAVNTVAQLQQRIACNRSGSRSFARFVLDVLDPKETDSALDIGPGLGAQLIPVGERVRSIVGLDVSSEMVAELRRRIALPNAAVVMGDMDDIGGLALGGPFTLAYAVYSLYYSRDPARVVTHVTGLLGGARARLVSITPDAGNNAEWFEDLGCLYDVADDARNVPHLCRRTILPAFLDTFRTVTRATYRDRVRFPTLDALMAYYDACAPYCRPDKRDEARRYFGRKFERDGDYQITKCSLALVGTL